MPHSNETVLVTGATGYIGRATVRRLLAEGYNVHALVRNPSRASVLPSGVHPIVGTLERFSAWSTALASVDAVVHTAFPAHGTAWADGVAIERTFLEALVSVLSGTGKTLIAANGTVFLGDSRGGRLDETRPVIASHPAAIRADAVGVVRHAPALRGIELRLASFVYGLGGSVFLPALLDAARRSRQSLVVEDGAVRTSALHVDAAADAFVAALRHGEAGAVYHVASDEEPSIAEIARAVAIAAGDGCSVTQVSPSEAARALDPFTAMFLATDNRLDTHRARRELGWSHAGFPTLLWDVAFGSYAMAKPAGLAAIDAH